MLLERCAEVGALIQREGIEFGVIDRQLAVGGQVLWVNASEGPVDEIFLPLHGAHQAANAAQALAAVEASLGMKALNPDIAREGFAGRVPRAGSSWYGGPQRSCSTQLQPSRRSGRSRRHHRSLRLRTASRCGRRDGIRMPAGCSRCSKRS